MPSYLVSGLIVASDLALPGLIPIADSIDADVVVRAAPIPTRLDGASASGPNWSLHDAQFLIAIPGILRMLLIDGAELRYEVDPDVPSAEAAVFVAGTGFGILLHQRRRIVLHASAVRVADHAVLLCGPSGAGKSTFAAALVERGHDLISDDFCAITMRADGVPLVEPDGRQMKLWQNAIDRLSLGERRTRPVRAALQKYYVEPRSVAGRALPLAAIYMLREARPPHVPGIASPNIVDAALLVRQGAYRPAMIERMGQKGLYFEAAARIAEQSGVFTLTRPFDFAALPGTIGWLEAHWRQLGLIERAA